MAKQAQILARRVRGDPRFADALGRLRNGERDTVLFDELVERWGNPFSADREYLAEVVRTVDDEAQDGMIVETGSGLTTLVLGTVAPGRVWALEHSRYWWAQTRLELLRHHVRARLERSPLVERDGNLWFEAFYNADPEWVSLVVCDGPPGHRGGRGGMVEGLRGWIQKQETVVLLDDTDRAAEQAILASWRDRYGAVFDVRGSRGHFARVTFGQ